MWWTARIWIKVHSFLVLRGSDAGCESDRHFVWRLKPYQTVSGGADKQSRRAEKKNKKKKNLHLRASFQKAKCKLEIIFVISFSIEPEGAKTVWVSWPLGMMLLCSAGSDRGMRLNLDWVQLKAWLLMMQCVLLNLIGRQFDPNVS